MSLINDALKRAEEDKNGQRPVKISKPERKDDSNRRGGHRSSLLLMGLICLAMLGGSLVAWLVVRSEFQPDLSLPHPAYAQAARRSEPTSSASEATTPSAADIEAEETLAKTLENLAYYHPPTGDVAATPKFAPTDTEAMEAESIEKQQASKAPGDAQAEAEPVEKPRYSVPPRSYKLSAIMRGPAGTTAIINGKFVKVGATIDDAKILRIGQHSVELELNGRKFTIQM